MNLCPLVVVKGSNETCENILKYETENNKVKWPFAWFFFLLRYRFTFQGNHSFFFLQENKLRIKLLEFIFPNQGQRKVFQCFIAAGMAGEGAGKKEAGVAAVHGRSVWKVCRCGWGVWERSKSGQGLLQRPRRKTSDQTCTQLIFMHSDNSQRVLLDRNSKWQVVGQRAYMWERLACDHVWNNFPAENLKPRARWGLFLKGNVTNISCFVHWVHVSE